MGTTVLEDTLTMMRENWPEAFNQRSSCVVMIQRLAALMQANARDVLARFQLGFTEFEILVALRAAPPPHELLPSALYDAVLISSGGLTKASKALEARGLVARPERPGDRRRRPIALTATGKALIEAAMAAVQAADAERLRVSHMSNADYARFERVLSRVLSGFE